MFAIIAVTGMAALLLMLTMIARFEKRMVWPRDWVHDCGIPVRPFSPGREAEEFRRARQEHYQAMSRQGLVDFPDVSATQWHYTFVGGLKYAVLNYSIGMLRAVTGGRVPRSA